MSAPGNSDQPPQRSGKSPIPSIFPISFTVIVLLGLVALGVYAVTQPSARAAASVLGISVLVAGASLLGGGLLGFLFGVPRSLQADSDNAAQGGLTGDQPATQPDASQRAMVAIPPVRVVGLYTGNTNLEQISDWLTKILVGVGLTQLGNLGKAAAAYAENLSEGFGGGATGEVAALATTIYYLFAGFLLGYIWTRAYLPGIFRWAERERFQQVLDAATNATLVATEAAETAGRAARSVREAARRALEVGALKYDTLREILPSTDERTRRLSELMSELRASAPQAALSDEEIREYASSANPGRRIVALAAIQAARDSSYADVLATFIAGSVSAFEQYEALAAAAAIDLDPSGAERIEQAIREQMQPDGYLSEEENADALPLARAVLRQIE